MKTAAAVTLYVFFQENLHGAHFALGDYHLCSSVFEQMLVQVGRRSTLCHFMVRLNTQFLRSRVSLQQT